MKFYIVSLGLKPWHIQNITSVPSLTSHMVLGQVDMGHSNGTTYNLLLSFPTSNESNGSWRER